MKKRVIAAAMVMMLGISSAFALTGCGGSDESGDAASAPENPNLRLATTTSTKDSGLLDAILPEKEFVDGGHADADGRLDVMYNDFVVVGPEADPAGIEENAKEDALKAFTTIEQEQQTFVSRADDSGTHKKELEIWEEAGITPKGDWYVEAAAGMGDVITMTDEMKGYTLSDRAT